MVLFANDVLEIILHASLYFFVLVISFPFSGLLGSISRQSKDKSENIKEKNIEEASKTRDAHEARPNHFAVHENGCPIAYGETEIFCSLVFPIISCVDDS